MCIRGDTVTRSHGYYLLDALPFERHPLSLVLVPASTEDIVHINPFCPLLCHFEKVNVGSVLFLHGISSVRSVAGGAEQCQDGSKDSPVRREPFKFAKPRKPTGKDSGCDDDADRTSACVRPMVNVVGEDDVDKE